jgi:hypothetical protein
MSGISESFSALKKGGSGSLRRQFPMTPPICLEMDFERNGMNRGYTFLWRKTWANPVLRESGKKL